MGKGIDFIRASRAYQPPTITCCQCVRTKRQNESFQCFYCFGWVCEACAPIHFGQSREAYRHARRIEENPPDYSI